MNGDAILSKHIVSRIYVKVKGLDALLFMVEDGVPLSSVQEAMDMLYSPPEDREEIDIALICAAKPAASCLMVRNLLEDYRTLAVATPGEICFEVIASKFKLFEVGTWLQPSSPRPNPNGRHLIDA